MSMKYVYFLRNGQDYYKVGVAINVASRMQTIQTSNPERVTLICSRLVRDAESVEARMHSELIERKSGGGTEWFMLTPEDALEVAARLNMEPQPRVLDRQITIETLLADMREERRQIDANVKALGQLIKNQLAEQADARAKVAARKIDSEFKAPVPVPQVEVVKPTMQQYEELALKVFKEVGGASSSLLQRRLGIGYAKAARIVDNLEEKGLIGPATGSSKPRPIAA